MQPAVYVDLRCLQDARYRVRGIGQHVAALLRARKRSGLSHWKTIGLVDPRSPALPESCASWVDEVSASVNPICHRTPILFIDGTPMTHDTRFSVRFQSHSGILRAAVLYDFIPLDWPGYLPTIASRMNYLAKLARLRTFDFFYPISHYTAWRAVQLLGAPQDRMTVTGASVRRGLYELRDRIAGTKGNDVTLAPYFLMVIAEDARKNPDVAIRAVRHLNLLRGERIPLKVVGHNFEHQKQHLLSLAGHREGEGFLEFYPGISDNQLVDFYSGAFATIVPSHVEGFSLPVVEAALCGCPVIASTCAAHLELIDQTEALFPSHDANALHEKLDALINNPSLRCRLIAGQAPLGKNFSEELVGERFWRDLERKISGVQKPAVLTKKPKFAFLSPCPPDQSGVARFTAMTMQANENLFHSDLYTDAPRPLAVEGGFRDAGPVSLAPFVAGQYDAVISVLGNSHFHSPIFDLFEKHGGPCILHDARLIQIYVHRLGHEKFLDLASRLLGRRISMDEVHEWLQTCNPESLLLEPIIERAAPLIVHTKTQQAQIKRMYGAEAEVLTCCPNEFFTDKELGLDRKRRLREKLGISPNAFLISSFGIVSPEKSFETCILALELLRGWHIPAELHFMGNANAHQSAITGLATHYGMREYVYAQADFIDGSVYRDFLVMSDAAVQLRTYAFGQFSGALADCVSAGLSCVATSDLAASCDAPGYVATVPDQFSPLHVAERLAEVWEAQGKTSDRRVAREAYLQTHNYQYYGRRLMEVLGGAA